MIRIIPHVVVIAILTPHIASASLGQNPATVRAQGNSARLDQLRSDASVLTIRPVQYIKTTPSLTEDDKQAIRANNQIRRKLDKAARTGRGIAKARTTLATAEGSAVVVYLVVDHGAITLVYDATGDSSNPVVRYHAETTLELGYYDPRPAPDQPGRFVAAPRHPRRDGELVLRCHGAYRFDF